MQVVKEEKFEFITGNLLYKNICTNNWNVGLHFQNKMGAEEEKISIRIIKD